jgi:hypothetical protein
MQRKYKPRPDNRFKKIWDCVENLIESQTILISREVYIEIRRGGDDLKDWIKSYKDLIVESTQKIQENVKYLANKYDFLIDPSSTQHRADFYVISLAMEHDGTVVTSEGNGSLKRHIYKDIEKMKISPNSVKMIDICENEDIRWADLVGFLADVGSFEPDSSILKYTKPK